MTCVICAVILNYGCVLVDYCERSLEARAGYELVCELQGEYEDGFAAV